MSVSILKLFGALKPPQVTFVYKVIYQLGAKHYLKPFDHPDQLKRDYLLAGSRVFFCGKQTLCYPQANGLEDLIGKKLYFCLYSINHRPLFCKSPPTATGPRLPLQSPYRSGLYF